MELKRILTTIIGLPLVALIFLFGNHYVIGGAILITSIICMNEYFGAVKKVSKPIEWVGYLSNIFIIWATFENDFNLMPIVICSIPVIMLLLFLQVILTNMKYTFKDVSYTFFGIMYIPFFLMFLELIRCMEHGKILIVLCFIISWATDIFAYLIGRYLGKHKLTKISPKKTIEGAVGGLIGAIVISLIYIFISNKFWGTEISYLFIVISSIILSIISQIGDLIASGIKRLVDVKDYGNIIPGHGGMLDRIDSLLFIAPFAYVAFLLFI